MIYLSPLLAYLQVPGQFLELAEGVGFCEEVLDHQTMPVLLGASSPL